MFELVDKRTGEIVEKHNYSFEEFIKNKYSRFCSLETRNGIVIGDVYPYYVWRKAKEESE